MRWEEEILRPVAEAYREVRKRGEGDQPAFLAALAKYRELRPEAVDPNTEVPRIIREAAEHYGQWLYGSDLVE